jgi:phosphopantothenoylcysteine synthetase/decarboxylase
MPSSVLQNKRFLITSGPMRAPIDAIRYLANTSSGRLGSLLAQEALGRGAEVTYVCGPDGARPGSERLQEALEKRLKILPVTTFDDLMKVIGHELSPGTYDVVLHAMAVLDYVPERASPAKTPSGQDRWTLTLVPTPKIIAMIKRWDPDLLLVGFKLEVDADRRELIAAALRLARHSGADLVVANDLRHVRDGRHQALVIAADGQVEGEYRGKEEVARGLLDVIEKRFSREE